VKRTLVVTLLGLIVTGCAASETRRQSKDGTLSEDGRHRRSRIDQGINANVQTEPPVGTLSAA
jgi:hypothetical protein